ncbi:hypothetical protein DFH09DRAFT_1326527 [Mycena vulgaris]|nr:hypothetical protein DFH09DRAFT_1326527 [Mycena vulgaris]
MDPSGLISPRLPPELECKIFTITSLSRPTTIPKLMLIAWRVKFWLGSIHQILGFPTFTAGILDRVILDKTPAFLQESARHLFLDGSSLPSSLATVLTACNNVTNLFRLCISVEALLNAPNTLLRTVTHLELLRTYNSDTRDLRAPLGLIPHLTHIAFHGALPSAILLGALCADTRLQCIIFPLLDYN